MKFRSLNVCRVAVLGLAVKGLVMSTKGIRIVIVAFAVALAPMSALAVPVTVNITQLTLGGFGLQPTSNGSFEQLAPTPTSYVINSDFKFFVGPEVFLGSVTGDIDSVIGIGDQGCSASDFAGFHTGSIALVRGTSCFFSDMVNLAFDAGAIGALVAVNISTLGTTNFGFVDAVSIPSVVIPRALADSLQSQLESVPEPATLALLGLGLIGIGVGRRRAQG